ncbi:MAG TPA: DUF5007 domain-containing protein [Chitinophaga sp.]|uniref:DUF5007 domain-containing protein n=1 Tax=Chitinophaga sp. TaxID=1869181 RepID=UPI002C961DCA|nr:DUF5007 domain-containing protein [Chitinophaga sp.]HVI48121.1 DUF5007 domain-containing protein [Chitinophaga sp.]
MLIFLSALTTGCYKEMLPKEKDYFSDNVSFNKDQYQVNIGRTNVAIGNFNPDYSTQPLDFTIENPQRADGSPAPELFTAVPAWQWQKYYSGNEKSIDEINAKRIRENRPALDIRPHSGDVVFWNTDSSSIKPGIYTFDIRVKNKGGEKLFQKRKLDIRRPRPYEPYEFNDQTGIRKEEKDGGIIHPGVSGLNDALNNEIKSDAVNVYFRKTGSQKNTITFKFFDKDSLPIKLSLFNTMQWDSLYYNSKIIDGRILFAFNRTMATDSSQVSFDIPNPFPVLADVGSSDERASISFTYDRVSFGFRKKAAVSLTFGIFEQGSWDIIFKFKTTPKFTND